PRAAGPVTGGYQYFGVGAGYYQLPIASLNAHLKYNFNLAEGFNSNVMYVGLERGRISHINSSYEFNAAGMMGFHYLLPQTITTPADTSGKTIDFTLRGWNVQWDGSSFDLLKSEKVVFTAGLGFCWGRTRIIRTDATGDTDYRNPYFNPMVRTELSVNLFDHLALGVRAAYRHDWSKTRWKIKDGNGPELPGTRLSGSMFGAFIAFSIPGKEKGEEVAPAETTPEPGQ
ncbi:MAG: hypothetical protein ACRC3B_13140, partial [Bacteroidia bacterium]